MERKEVAVTATIVVLVALTAFDIYQRSTVPSALSCDKSSDCVPAGCCHPAACINSAYKPDCTDIMCTMVCSGPLDCGAGSCGCVEHSCAVVPK